jgi:hypothetical protein
MMGRATVNEVLGPLPPQERLASRLHALGARFNHTGGWRRRLFRLLYLLRVGT